MLDAATPLVDLHCHLDLYQDHAGVVAECDVQRVYTLAVTTTPRAWPRNLELASRTRHVRAALGMHPQLVASRASEMSLWEQYLPQARYVGEVGLDAGPRHFRSLPMQKVVFERILKLCALAGGKVLTVHSVRAASAVLDLVEEHLPPARGCVVLHWFTGSRAEARRAVDLGCYFSVNAEMLKKPRHRTVVGSLPLERLLTETDGPFVQCGVRQARPTDVRDAVVAMAGVLDLAPTVVGQAILSNLRQLISSVGGSPEEL